MGCYDTFYDPAIPGSFQCKAFGKRMEQYYPGDAVTAQRVPGTRAEFNANLAGDWDGTVQGLTTSTFQADCWGDGGEESYVNVVDGIYTGITTTRNPQVPLISNHGHLHDENDSGEHVRGKAATQEPVADEREEQAYAEFCRANEEVYAQVERDYAPCAVELALTGREARALSTMVAELGFESPTTYVQHLIREYGAERSAARLRAIAERMWPNGAPGSGPVDEASDGARDSA